MLRDAKKSCELFPTRVIRTVETQRSFSSDLLFQAGSRLLSGLTLKGHLKQRLKPSTPLAKISYPWVDLVVLIDELGGKVPEWRRNLRNQGPGSCREFPESPMLVSRN